MRFNTMVRTVTGTQYAEDDMPVFVRRSSGPSVNLPALTEVVCTRCGVHAVIGIGYVCIDVLSVPFDDQCPGVYIEHEFRDPS